MVYVHHKVGWVTVSVMMVLMSIMGTQYSLIVKSLTMITEIVMVKVEQYQEHIQTEKLNLTNSEVSDIYRRRG